MAYKDSDYTIGLLSCTDSNVYFWCWNSPWCWSFCLPVGCH